MKLWLNRHEHKGKEQALSKMAAFGKDNGKFGYAHKLPRRSVFGLALGAWAIGVGAASALDKTEAKDFVVIAMDGLTRLYTSSSARPELLKDSAEFFHKYADVPAVARTVIGPQFRAMSKEQQREYIKAFEGFVVRKYTDEFIYLQGGKSEVVRVASSGSAVLVDTHFFRPNRPRVIVSFLVAGQKGSTRIIDLRLNGVSLVLVERLFVRNHLAKTGNNFDALIAELKRRK